MQVQATVIIVIIIIIVSLPGISSTLPYQELLFVETKY